MSTVAVKKGTGRGASSSHAGRSLHDVKNVTPILIYADNEKLGRSLDRTVAKLLSLYGYSEDDVIRSREFFGSWFKLKVHREAKEVVTDIELTLGEERAPSAEVPEQKRKLIEKIQTALENGKAFIIVGTLCVTTIGTAAELYKTWKETFPPKKEIRQVEPKKQEQHELLLVELPKTITPKLLRADTEMKALEAALAPNILQALQSRSDN